MRGTGATCLLLLASSGAGGEGADLAPLFAAMGEAAERVTDYTCRFTKQEEVGGTLRPTETIVLKQSRPLGCIYMRWTGEPHRNRETIYCRERYGGRLQVHEGGGVAGWLGTLSLDPAGAVAMRGERHPITEAGILYTVDTVRRSLERARARGPTGEPRADVHEAEVEGQPSVCATIEPGAPGEQGYAAARVEVCSHRSLHLPTRLRVWEPDGRLVEHYTYADYGLNPGLTERDFDTANRDYGF